MSFDTHDRAVLRDLARQVADIAAMPAIAERRRRWVEHNSLRSTYPMMLVFPEGAWEELLPPSALACAALEARVVEQRLRERLYTYHHFQDDTVIEAEWVVRAVCHDTGWGYEPARTYSDSQRGAYHVDPVLTGYPPVEQVLRWPDLVYDEAATVAQLTTMQDLFGDILTVRRVGIDHVSYHLAAQYLNLRGLGNMLTDLIDAPAFVHEVMAFFEAGHRRLLGQAIDLNMLSLNNDNTYQSSGGNGYTDQLPAPGFDPAHVRPCDMWASAKSQEFSTVSPRMHDEFVMQYERRLLEPFGLTGCGCCEDLSHKLDYVFSHPPHPAYLVLALRRRRPVRPAAAGHAIFSWKPHPAHLVGDFDPALVRRYVRHTLDMARANGCVLEMILKDTHTCQHHPERFDEWTRHRAEEIHACAG